MLSLHVQDYRVFIKECKANILLVRSKNRPTLIRHIQVCLIDKRSCGKQQRYAYSRLESLLPNPYICWRLPYSRQRQ
uniref:Uncharacterized protein n=1 Tax=Arundo donax TaxID=35708 RepID=A0A0A9HPA7_ARUDO